MQGGIFPPFSFSACQSAGIAEISPFGDLTTLSAKGPLKTIDSTGRELYFFCRQEDFS
jgi:hypothetical protein